jgi:hypothetical protein
MSNDNTDDELLAKVARVLSDRAANECGVNKDDSWKEYGSVYIGDAHAVLAAVRAHDAAKEHPSIWQERIAGLRAVIAADRAIRTQGD